MYIFKIGLEDKEGKTIITIFINDRRITIKTPTIISNPIYSSNILTIIGAIILAKLMGRENLTEVLNEVKPFIEKDVEVKLE